MRIFSRLQSQVKAIISGGGKWDHGPIALAQWRKQYPDAHRAAVDKATERIKKTNMRKVWEELRGKGAVRTVERGRRLCIANHRLTIPKDFSTSQVTVTVKILDANEVESNLQGVLGGRYQLKLVSETGECIYYTPASTRDKQRTLRRSTPSRPFGEPEEQTLVELIQKMDKEFGSWKRTKPIHTVP